MRRRRRRSFGLLGHLLNDKCNTDAEESELQIGIGRSPKVDSEFGPNRRSEIELKADRVSLDGDWYDAE